MKQRKTQEQFEREIQEKFNGEYTVLGKYMNSKSKIEVTHNKCGHIFKVNPNIINSNYIECPKCKNKIKRKIQEQFEKEIQQENHKIINNNEIQENHKIINNNMYEEHKTKTYKKSKLPILISTAPVLIYTAYKIMKKKKTK